MNMDFTLMDAYAYRRGLTNSESAKFAAERAVYDALVCDCEFRRNAGELYSKGHYEELSLMLKSVIQNEAVKCGSDARMPEGALSPSKNFEELDRSMRLYSALELLDCGLADYISIYRNAWGMAEMLLGLFRELSKRDETWPVSKR